MPTILLIEIRDSINKAWILGDGRFKQQIEKKTGRRASPNARGGDEKSERYRARKKSLTLTLLIWTLRLGLGMLKQVAPISDPLGRYH